MLNVDLIKSFNRRTLLLGGGKIIVFSVLIGHVFRLQILDSKKYKHLSNRNTFRLHILVPPRGRIYDRYDVVLADNTRRYSLFLKPEEVSQSSSIEDVLAFLSEHLDLNPEDQKKILNLIQQQGKVLPLLVEKKLEWEKMAPIAARQFDIPGIFIETDIIRQYPLKEHASHAIGYVALDNKDDRYKDYRFLYRVPDLRTGKSGVERFYDSALTGHPGELVQMVNATGRVSESFEPQKKDPIAGKDLKLTIDSRLQEEASRVFTHESGSAIVMDCHTGEVLCLASFPQYDLQKFEGRLDPAYYGDLVKDPYRPLMNKTIEGLYSPGSTFKILVALAALEEGIITPEETVHCPGFMMVGKQRFHCWEKTGHGTVALIKAIRESCDIYFYKLGVKLGIDKINSMAERLGVAALTGIDLVGEKKGNLSNKQVKLDRLGERWTLGDTVMASIGQSFTLMTPLQLTVMMARLVNGGKAVLPRLTKQDSMSFPDLGFNPQNVELIKQGMFEVINEKGGTATGSFFDVKGIKMGGKTGTTQVRRISMQERMTGVRSQSALPWHLRNHALFMGYTPTDTPRFVAGVVIEHGGSGSAAGRIVSALLKKTVELYQ